MSAVKLLANFLMFTVSEENTVKCLGGSLDIVFVRHLRLSLLNNLIFIATFSISI